MGGLAARTGRPDTDEGSLLTDADGSSAGMK